MCLCDRSIGFFYLFFVDRVFYVVILILCNYITNVYGNTDENMSPNSENLRSIGPTSSRSHSSPFSELSFHMFYDLPY